MTVWQAIDKLVQAPTMEISLDRVQLAEREERRAALDRELSGRDAQDCFDRVARRMRDGDKNWIPPMYNRTKFFREWRRKHRRFKSISRIEQVS